MIGKVQDLMTTNPIVGPSGSAVNVNKDNGNSSGGKQQQSTTVNAEKPKTTGETMAKAKGEAVVKAAMEKQVAKEDEKLRVEKVQDEKLDEQQVTLAMQQINKLMSKMNCNLQFEYNKDVNFMSVKMIDKKTHEVIKEVPPEEMIRHMKNHKDWIGAFIDQNA